MLGLQQQHQSPHTSFHSSSSFSSFQKPSLASASASAAAAAAASPITNGGGNSNMDERSLKEIVDVLTRQINATNHLAEFSNVLQIQNSSLPSLLYSTFFSIYLYIDHTHTHILNFTLKTDMATLSGHTDFFYPSLAYQSPSVVSGGGGGGAQYQLDLPEISKIKHVPMPLELVEQINRKSFSLLLLLIFSFFLLSK
jgi:hypothetical protein